MLLCAKILRKELFYVIVMNEMEKQMGVVARL